MKAPDERLLVSLARRNWILLGLLVALSLLSGSRAVVLGVASGGLVAIIGWTWMGRSLRRVIDRPEPGAARRFQIGYLLRLGSLAAALVVLIVVVRVHPLALAAGLSVVVLNILLATVQQLFPSRRR